MHVVLCIGGIGHPLASVATANGLWDGQILAPTSYRWCGQAVAASGAHRLEQARAVDELCPVAGPGGVSLPHHPALQFLTVLVPMLERDWVHLSPYALCKAPWGLAVILITDTELQSLSMTLNSADSILELEANSSSSRNDFMCLSRVQSCKKMHQYRGFNEHNSCFRSRPGYWSLRFPDTTHFQSAETKGLYSSDTRLVNVSGKQCTQKDLWMSCWYWQLIKQLLEGALLPD